MFPTFRNFFRQPTICGVVALVLWSFSAVSVCLLAHIPVFQLAAIVGGIGVTVTAVRITLIGKWSEMRQPLHFWVFGIFLIGFNEWVYLFALKNAPPEQADLINYLWPLLLLLSVGLLPKERISLVSLIGAAIGFAGIYILLTWGGKGGVFRGEYLWGYVAAFLAAISWVVYILFSKSNPHKSPEFVGLYFGGMALFCGVVHFQYEQTVIPTLFEWTVLAFTGIAIHGSAFPLWDFAMKKGAFDFLSMLSYFTPISSILILILFGQVEGTAGLGIACVFVTFGNLFPKLVTSIFSPTPVRAKVQTP